MDDGRFEKALKVREALDRADTHHPDSRAVRSLHRRLGDLLEDFRADLSEEQFIALGGGTPKTDED